MQSLTSNESEAHIGFSKAEHIFPSLIVGPHESGVPVTVTVVGYH